MKVDPSARAADIEKLLARRGDRVIDVRVQWDHLAL